MPASVHRLPDLARMRRIACQVRSSRDSDVAALLATDDGRWFVNACGSHAPDDVVMRVAMVIANVLQQEAVDDLASAFVGEVAQ